MDETISNLIYSWRGKIKNLQSKGFNDEFVHFFIYYMCLDAWITNESKKGSDTEKISWLVNKGGILKDVFINKRFDRQDSIKLKHLSPIEDMRPHHEGEMTYLNDVKNFEEVVKFIYQIRCNLFHGAKSPDSRKDKDLVVFAGSFLEKWISCAYSQSNCPDQII
jgi:hypothetical protein